MPKMLTLFFFSVLKSIKDINNSIFKNYSNNHSTNNWDVLLFLLALNVNSIEIIDLYLSNRFI